MRLLRTNPVYPVSNVAVSIDWYKATLGLTPGHLNQASDGPNYAVLYSEGTPVLHLLRKCEAPHGLCAPVEAQFWIDGDVDHLFARVSALDTTVIEPPANRAWGHRDFIVADPDSNLVWITEPLPS